MHTPWAIRRMNRLTLWLVDLIKRPITIAVLDEVADVLQIGHYTKNISAALVENHDELVAPGRGEGARRPGLAGGRPAPRVRRRRRTR